ncbi:proline--tRNA ligase [Anaerococcus octavius]|uniref:Proline--tRNA ligase n=2 Tax=Anaerococcus TaxID=165779 RepID=A0A2I1MAG5_9FIRM|nr:proline--tRNA ligase [Anaerococcus octavius]PKZ17097.1 proline--tRNA ligase [Anaerococcus octavius]
MRLTNYYMPTLRDDPADAEVVSHKLLVRGAFVRKQETGIYSYLPLGMKVKNKIYKIVCDAMEDYDSVQVETSMIQPKELWQASGRWQTFGPEMLKMTDRLGREYCFGPTAEEYFADLVKNELVSYKQLPLNLYQIVEKFRDERRPRNGIIRARSFLMKDAYSFDEDYEGLKAAYQKMWDAYVQAFDNMRIDYKIVQGDTGAMGGRVSHEFIAPAENGEGIIFYTDESDYAATIEKAAFIKEYEKEELKDIELVKTTDKTTIKDVSEFLNVPEEKLVKTVDLKVQGQPVFVFVPGDRELNMAKLIAYLQVPEHEIEMMDDEMILEYTGAEPGYTGPKGLLNNPRIIIDKSITKMTNTVIGANKKDHHYMNATFGRDFDGEVAEDLLTAKEGDMAIDGSGKLKSAEGIEVGNIFQLGTKYSESIGAYYLDRDGKQKPIVMGSYGIGVSRSIAAIIEQNYDENGIIWPTTVAPFEAIITTINIKDEEQKALSEEIYEKLQKNGIDVLFDDRQERAGVKFNDRDLIGIPYRITVGKDSGDKKVEYSTRREGINEKVEVDEAINKVVENVKADLVMTRHKPGTYEA